MANEIKAEIKAALEVWLLNQHAGTLWLQAGELQFQYSALWLGPPGGAVCRSGVPTFFLRIAA
jgi:hypothetical protein